MCIRDRSCDDETAASVDDYCSSGRRRLTHLDECVRCPEGTDCPTDGGSTLQNLHIEEGYWRISASSEVFYECPMPGACVGGTTFTNKGDSYCNMGHEGFLCDVCADRYFFKKEEKRCSPCDGEGSELGERVASSSTLIVAIVIVALILIAAVVSMVPRINNNKYVKKIKGALGKLKKGAAKARMLIATWQITLAISFNCVIAFPDLFEEALSYLAIASLDIVPELGLDCYYASFDYASKMVAVSLAPIGVAVLLCMVFFLSTWCSSGDNLEERYRLRVASYSCKFNQVKYLKVVPGYFCCRYVR